MGKVLIINKTRLTQSVDVVHDGGKADKVRVAPQSRAHLRDGMTVSKRWLDQNPDVLRVVEPKDESITAVAAADKENA